MQSETDVFPSQEIPYRGNAITYTAEYNDLGYLVSSSNTGLEPCKFLPNPYGEYERYCDTTFKYTNDYEYNFINGQLIKNISNYQTSFDNSENINTITYSYDTLKNIVKKVEGNDTYVYQYDNQINPYLLKTISKNGEDYANYNYLPSGEVSSFEKGNNTFDINYTSTMKVKNIVNNLNNIITSYGYDLNNVLTSKATTLNDKQTSEVIYFANMMINKNTGQISIPYNNELLNIDENGEVENLSASFNSFSGGSSYKFKIPVNTNNISNASNLANFQTYTSFGSKDNQHSIKSIYNLDSWNPISFANIERDYQNQLTNADSGLQYLGGNRLYDPEIGRFLQKDPLGHEYTYAGNNPISYNDVSGLIKKYKDDDGTHSKHKNCGPGDFSFICGPERKERQDKLTAQFVRSMILGQGMADLELVADLGVEMVGSVTAGLTGEGAEATIVVMNHYAFGDSWNDATKHAAENEAVLGPAFKAYYAYSEGKYIEGTMYAMSELMLFTGLGFESGILMRSTDMIIEEEIDAAVAEEIENEGTISEERRTEIKEDVKAKYKGKTKYKFRDHLRGSLKEWAYYNYISGRGGNPYIDTSSWKSYFETLGIIYATNLAATALEGVPYFEETAIQRVGQKMYDYTTYQLPVLIYDGPEKYGIAIGTGIGTSYALSWARWRFSKVCNPFLMRFAVKLGVSETIYQSGLSNNINSIAPWSYDMYANN